MGAHCHGLKRELFRQVKIANSSSHSRLKKNGYFDHTKSLVSFGRDAENF